MKFLWKRRTVPGRTRRTWLPHCDADGFATYTMTFWDGAGNPLTPDASTLATERSWATDILLELLPPPPGAIGIRVYRGHDKWTERRPLSEPWWARLWPGYRTRYETVDHPATMELITEERWVLPIKETEDATP